MNRKMMMVGILVFALFSTAVGATDVDGDGLYEDVNDDGIFDINDVTYFYQNVTDDELNESRFDFNEDGSVDIVDVNALYQEGNFASGDLSSSQDLDGDGLHEDINGDDSLTIEDVEIFFDNFDSVDSSNYDFNEDGSVDVVDVHALYLEVGHKTSPEVSGPTPEDGRVIEKGYFEMMDGEDIDLGVKADDPADGNVTVRFFDADNDDKLAEIDERSQSYNATWNVGDYGEYQWYVEAEDEQENVTVSDTYSFKIENPDDTPPSITLDSVPSGTQLERDITVEASTSEDAKLEYSIDGGDYSQLGGGWDTEFKFDIEDLSKGEHEITLKASDRAKNTNTKSFTFKVADGSEVNFQINVEESYPGSGVPIDPDSAFWSEDTEVDFNYSLEKGGESIDISNHYEDGLCDFYGDEGWHLGDDYFCGTEIPDNIETNSDYDLVAEWNIRGENKRVIDDSFAINEITSWYSNPMSHGGRVEGSPSIDAAFEDEYTYHDGQMLTCAGNQLKVKNIDSVTARCSNGVTSTSTPPVVSFVNKDGEKVSTSNNNMFGDSNCKIGGGVTRQQLFGTAGLSTDDMGYLPEDCNIKWQLGGTQSFNVYNFDEAGDYNVFVDMVNAVSNSPDYICPARTDNNNLCYQGSLKGDEHGWENVESYQVKVLNPQGDTGFSFSSNVEKSGKYLKREDYTGDISGTASFENVGTGRIQIKSLNIECPDQGSCDSMTDMPLEVDTGKSADLVWSAELPDDERVRGPLKVEVTFDDAYGMDCSAEQTVTKEYFIDEEDPSTSTEVE